MNMMIPDQFARWRHALAGHLIDFGQRGDPASGYYRNPYTSKDRESYVGPTGAKMAIATQEFEAVAIWRDENGTVQCLRTVFGDGSKMSVDEIDELFGTCGRYPISYELYQAVAERGEPWPHIHRTRLRTKDMIAGVVWTEAWARTQLAAELETHDERGNPRELIGGNHPPNDLTPDQALAKRILDLDSLVDKWLSKIGGTPTTQAEAEVLANYANKFKDFENEAVSAHKIEKEPHLKAGRAVDAKWFGPIRDKAATSRQKIISLIRAFESAEDAKRAEAARVVNELARKAAETQARTSDTLVEPVSDILPEKAKVTTLRGGGGGRRQVAKLVTDPKLFLEFCLSLQTVPPELSEAMEKIARRWTASGTPAPGMEDVKARILS